MAVLNNFQTKKTYKRDDISPMNYVDPGAGLIDYTKIPEGTTFPAPSLIPKEYLSDPNVFLPSDRSPIDWTMTSETGGNNGSTEERNQRALVREYLTQKYNKEASNEGVEKAMNSQNRTNDLADFGHAIDRAFTAQSVARGGPGVDESFWKGMKQQGAQGVADQENLKQAKIKDYLTKKQMGDEGVKELQQMHTYDITNAQNDPSSNISRTYQSAFDTMFPKESESLGEDIKNMSATEISGIAKMYGAKADAEFKRNVEMAKLGYVGAGNDLKSREIGVKETAVTNMAPKTQAEIDRIKAETKLADARTKAVQTAKPKPAADGSKPTKAYEAVDRDYAKQYNEWTTTGRSSYQKNRKLLEDAKNSLSSLSNTDKGKISGRGTSVLGNISGGLLRSDKSLQIENDVKQAAQASIKAVLGSQFTEKEGENIMNRSYDVRLSPEENVKKIDRALNEIDTKAKAEEERANWFEKNGTTYGFKSTGQNEHEQAMEWARNHPDDPRSAAILNLRGGN